MSLLFRNICLFDGCHLEFFSSNDLVQHVEETHVTEETAHKYKPDLSQLAGTPVSVYSRMFGRLPEKKAIPLSLTPVTLCNLPERKRNFSSPFLSSADRILQNAVGHPSLATTDRDVVQNILGAAVNECEDQKSVSEESLSSDSTVAAEEVNTLDVSCSGLISFGATGQEKRYACSVEGCNKRYKNLNGIRSHTKTAHGSESVPAAVTRPYRCTCGKSYKTTTGLQNHAASSHHHPQTPMIATLFKTEPGFSRTPASPSRCLVKSSTQSLQKSFETAIASSTSVIGSPIVKMPSGGSGRFHGSAVVSVNGSIASTSSGVGIHVQVQPGNFITPSTPHPQQQMVPLSPMVAIASNNSDHSGQNGGLAAASTRITSVKGSYGGPPRAPRRHIPSSMRPQQHGSPASIVIQSQTGAAMTAAAATKIVSAGVSSKGFGTESFTTYPDSARSPFQVGNIRVSSPKR